MDAYENIINLPHHKSDKRRWMPIADRAAQFAPFAALNGHGEIIKETARYTLQKKELDDQEKELLNEKLCKLAGDEGARSDIIITYFKADEKKAGGEYITAREHISRIKVFDRVIIMQSGLQIDIDNIFEIEILKTE